VEEGQGAAIDPVAHRSTVNPIRFRINSYGALLNTIKDHKASERFQPAHGLKERGSPVSIPRPLAFGRISFFLPPSAEE